MNLEELREHCIGKKLAEESFPFGNDTLVFKVGGKVFILLSLTASPIQFNAKCEPDRAVELREKYSAIQPGYHMNKAHWNTIVCDGSLPKKLILSLIDDSYALVAGSLPKKLRDALI